jgi:uncharacterized protein YqeY
MSIIEKLKSESMRLRKERNPIAASITFAMSEIEKVGKNNGNRQTTEDEAIKVVQKLIVTIDGNINLSTDDGRKIAFNYEKNILSSVLPQMASEEEVSVYLDNYMTTRSKMGETPKKGEIMKAIRDQFGAKVDMKRSGEIITEKFGV